MRPTDQPSPKRSARMEIAVGKAELIRRRELSARELTELTLGRIERLDYEVNAFAAVYADQALREAARIDRRAGGEDSTPPLLGVPVAVKDEIDIAGEVTSHGTGAAVRRAEADAEVVRRLRSAGAVVVGKTTMSELLRPTTCSLRTTKDCYEPATRWARRFGFQATENEPTPHSRFDRAWPARRRLRSCSATKGAMQQQLTTHSKMTSIGHDR